MSGKTSNMVNYSCAKIPGFNTKLLYLFIVVLCFVLYGNTIPNHYSLDDELVTYNNKRVEGGIKAIPGIWTTFYSEGQLRYEYRPVVKTTFAIEYQFFGQNPHASHFINILLYALTALLLFKILRKLFASYSPLLSFLAVLIFIVHPVHTEVVASLKNRDEILSFLGCITALWFIMKYADRSKFIYLVYAFISYILAYFSKSSAIVFVAVIPLVLYFYGKTSVKKIGLIFLLIFVAMIAARFFPKTILPPANRDVFFFENPLFFFPSLAYKIPMGLLSLLFYLKMLVFPHPLVFYYGYNMIPMVPIANLWVILAGIIYLALLVYAIMGIRKRTVISFSILYFLITISMFSNLIKPAMGIVAERYLYASSLGFCIIIAFLILKIFRMEKVQGIITRKMWIKAIIPLLIILIPFSAKTIVRNPDWNTHMSLYRHDMRYLQKSGKANAMIAVQMMQDVTKSLNNGVIPDDVKAKTDSMIYFFHQSIKVLPSYYSSYNNVGIVYVTLIASLEKDYFKQRDYYKRAIWYFQQAVKLKPKFFDANYNLALTNEKTGNFKEAVKYYHKSCKLDSTSITSWSNMANIYNDYFKNIDSAIIINKKIMQLTPASDVPFVNIGTYYLMRSDSLHAMKYFEDACAKNPSNRIVAGFLYSYYVNKDNIKAEKYRNMAGIPPMAPGNK